MFYLSKKNGGYSLVEVMVAMVGLSLVVLLLTSVLTTTLKTNSAAQNSDYATMAAKSKLNELISQDDVAIPSGAGYDSDIYIAPNKKEYSRRWEISKDNLPYKVSVKAWLKGSEKNNDTPYVVIAGYIDPQKICGDGEDVEIKNAPVILKREADISKGIENNPDVIKGNPTTIQVEYNYEFSKLASPKEADAAAIGAMFLAFPVGDDAAKVKNLKFVSVMGSSDAAKLKAKRSGVGYEVWLADGITVKENDILRFDAWFMNCAGEPSASSQNKVYVEVKFVEGKQAEIPCSQGTINGSVPSSVPVGTLSYIPFSYNQAGAGQTVDRWEVVDATGKFSIDNDGKLLVPADIAVNSYVMKIIAYVNCSGGGNTTADRQVTIVVEACNITSGAPYPLTISNVSNPTANFQLMDFSSFAGQNISWTGINGGGGLTFNPATGYLTFSSNPSGQGPYNITLRGTPSCNGVSGSSADWTVSVTLASTPPPAGNPITVPNTFNAFDQISGSSGGGIKNGIAECGVGNFVGGLTSSGGSWLEYKINVPVSDAGDYNISLNYAHNTDQWSADNVSVSVGGVSKGNIDISSGSGWCGFNWSTPKVISLSAGNNQTLRLAPNRSVNIKDIKIEKVSSGAKRHEVPGNIHACERSFLSSFAPPPNEERCEGDNIGYLTNGSYVEYLLNVNGAGSYKISLEAAEGNGVSPVITISNAGGSPSLGTITVSGGTGWANYSTKEATVTLPNGNMTLRLTVNGAVNIKNINITKVTLTYTVTFSIDGGSPVSSITNVASGSTITKPTDPTKSGYTFGGWYKESALTNAWNFASDVVNLNITLYAKWTAVSGGTDPCAGVQQHNSGIDYPVGSKVVANTPQRLYEVLNAGNSGTSPWISTWYWKDLGPCGSGGGTPPSGGGCESNPNYKGEWGVGTHVYNCSNGWGSIYCTGDIVKYSGKYYKYTAGSNDAYDNQHVSGNQISPAVNSFNKWTEITCP